MDERYRIGEFARRAGVTVRTLHHYDRLGLLRPAQRSEGRYRLYGGSDLVRLQQIVTLKALGFELEAILPIVDATDFDLGTALRTQIRLLEERRHKLGIAIEAMRYAERCASDGDTLRWNTLAPAIKAMIGMNDIDYAKYFTHEQLAAFGKRNFSAEDQAHVSRRWERLLADIEASLHEKARSPAAQALLERWDALIAEFTQNDPALDGALHELYRDPENRAKATRAMPGLPAASSFIERARAARPAR